MNPIIPKFKNPQEEAAWWLQNQDFALETLLRAQREGKLTSSSVTGKQAAKSTTIRLAPRDLELAKAQAVQKGLRYQTYLKVLLHEALEKEALKTPLTLKQSE